MPRYYERDFEWASLRDTAAASQAAQALEAEDYAAAAASRGLAALQVAAEGAGGLFAPAPPSACPGSGCARAAWDAFHASHATAAFFRPKRYLSEAFPELKASVTGWREPPALEWVPKWP